MRGLGWVAQLRTHRMSPHNRTSTGTTSPSASSQKLPQPSPKLTPMSSTHSAEVK